MCLWWKGGGGKGGWHIGDFCKGGDLSEGGFVTNEVKKENIKKYEFIC